MSLPATAPVAPAAGQAAPPVSESAPLAASLRFSPTEAEFFALLVDELPGVAVRCAALLPLPRAESFASFGFVATDSAEAPARAVDAVASATRTIA